MFWLGLLLPIIYVPCYTGAAIPTQWALLSLMLPPLIWRIKPIPIDLGFLGAAFMMYAAMSFFWAPQLTNAVYGLWIVLLWGLSFTLGARVEQPAGLYRGLACGMGINSAFAIVEWFGYLPVHTFLDTNIAGLLFNRTLLSACAALVILGLVQMRLWHYIPLTVFSLVLSGSRGGFLILAVGLLSKLHWIAILPPVLIAVYFAGTNSSDLQRLEVWGITIRGLTWLGWSVGSFVDITYSNGHQLTHPEFVHNDYLQLWFEFGIAAIIPIALLVLAILWRPNPTLYAVAVLAGFYFPLYAPVTAFIAAFWVGHSLRGFNLHGLVVRHSGYDLVLWCVEARRQIGQVWRGPVSVQSGTQE